MRSTKFGKRPGISSDFADEIKRSLRIQQRLDTSVQFSLLLSYSKSKLSNFMADGSETAFGNYLNATDIPALNLRSMM